MLTLKVPLAEAQKVKKELIDSDNFAHGYRVRKDKDYLYFPLLHEFTTSYELIQQDVPATSYVKPSTLKEALVGKVPSAMLERIKTSYDHVGDIAILEIDEELKAYEKIIGETLLRVNTKVATVLAKDAGHEGTFRTQKMRLIAGQDKRIAVHKENGVTLEVDVEDVYYSARLSTERKRIAELVKPGEDVLVMFSGCGPYTCVLAKNTQAMHVTGVEINPAGHALALKNIAKNKLKTAETHCGDVRRVVPELLKARCGLGWDRLLMPLPKSAETFLDVALQAAKAEACIHFYAFLHMDEFDKAREWIQEACDKEKVTCTFLATTKCGQQAPYVFRICVDVRISKP